MVEEHLARVGKPHHVSRGGESFAPASDSGRRSVENELSGTDDPVLEEHLG
jgi:hypothetical protein